MFNKTAALIGKQKVLFTEEKNLLKLNAILLNWKIMFGKDI